MGERAATNCSRSMALTSSRLTARPSTRATSGPDWRPTWKNIRLRTTAVIEPIVTPDPKRIASQDGIMPARSGLKVTSRARPIEEETMTALRLSCMSTLARVWMPTTATEANMASDAPPMTGEGIAATTAPALGSRPRRIMRPPAAVTTHRDFTWVRRTSPTFCAKQV